MAEQSVAVVVDSAASLPDGLTETCGLYTVPMTLSIKGTTYLDGKDISPTEFYRLLRESDELPKPQRQLRGHSWMRSGRPRKFTTR